jgi:hypothetical protein
VRIKRIAVIGMTQLGATRSDAVLRKLSYDDEMPTAPGFIPSGHPWSDAVYDHTKR